MLDLAALDDERRRWIQMGGALEGVELEIRHSGPREQERFRQKLIRSGVMKQDGGNVQIAAGREDDFFRAYAEKYVTNWRGDIQPKDAPYDSVKMGAVIGVYPSAFDLIGKALSEEADFFHRNGDGSTG